MGRGKRCIGYAGEGSWDLIQSGCVGIEVGSGYGIGKRRGVSYGGLNADKGCWKCVLEVKLEPEAGEVYK